MGSKGERPARRKKSGHKARSVDRSEPIEVRGCQQHNLKNIDVDIPAQSLTVITGVSGSGKSSLALHTLYAEGQRRYVESFSAYARQFLDRMARPAADAINNVPPAVAIEQSTQVRTSRSTVATMTELTDYLKLLFARMGVLYSRAWVLVQKDTPQSMLKLLIYDCCRKL